MIIRQKNEENESNTKQNILENIQDSNGSLKLPENDPASECNKSGQHIKKADLKQRCFDSKNKEKSFKQKTPPKLVAKCEVNEVINNPSNNGKIVLLIRKQIQC